MAPRQARLRQSWKESFTSAPSPGSLHFDCLCVCVQIRWRLRCMLQGDTAKQPRLHAADISRQTQLSQIHSRPKPTYSILQFKTIRILFQWRPVAMPAPSTKDTWACSSICRSAALPLVFLHLQLEPEEVGERPGGAELPFAAQMALLRNSTPSCERRRRDPSSAEASFSLAKLQSLGPFEGYEPVGLPSQAKPRLCHQEQGAVGGISDEQPNRAANKGETGGAR